MGYKFFKNYLYMDKYIELTLTDRVHLSMREQYAMRFISNGIAVPHSLFQHIQRTAKNYILTLSQMILLAVPYKNKSYVVN